MTEQRCGLSAAADTRCNRRDRPSEGVRREVAWLQPRLRERSHDFARLPHCLNVVSDESRADPRIRAGRDVRDGSLTRFPGHLE